MKFLLAISFSLSLITCSEKPAEWKPEWNRHENDFKKVVDLIQLNKLSLTTGRTAYIIPDSINLKDPCDQKVIKLDDQNKE